MSLRRDSNLGERDFQGVQDETAQKKSKRKTSYQRFSAEDRFKIGKYASENGVTAALRKFKKSILIWTKVQFKDLNQIMRKSWKKVSDNQERRKFFLKKKRALIEAWGYWSNGLRLPQGAVSFYYLFFW